MKAVSERIDELIEAAAGGPLAKQADDAEFLRRVYLDLAGTIPSADETRTFLSDSAPDKRTALIDRLLGGLEFPRRMSSLFHVMLMERLGDDEGWTKYLHDSFAANKSWSQMAREIVHPDAANEATRGSAFFLSKRLENGRHRSSARHLDQHFNSIPLLCHSEGATATEESANE